MITVTVSIVSLLPSTSPSAFLDAIHHTGLKPITVARMIQWIITATYQRELLAHNWHFMLILPPGSILPEPLTSLCAHIFSISLKEADDFPSTYKANSPSHLHPTTTPPAIVNLSKPNPLIATSTQHVELTPSLVSFAHSTLCPKGTVSMLNFISFHPTTSAKESYAAYIEGFKAGAGSKRGGAVKMLGSTVDEDADGVWDEVVLAQYSSLAHFADMMADEEYQQINKRLRLPALRDTCILMTTELELDWHV